MARIARVLLVAMPLLGSASTAMADIVVNGNFEGGTTVDPASGNVLPVGWTLGPPYPSNLSKVNVSTATNPATGLGPESGASFLRYQSSANLYNGNADCVYQDLNTVVGQSYTVSFWVAITGDSTFGNGANTGLNAIWDESGSNYAYMDNSAYFNPSGALSYAQFTYTEVASSSITRIDFHGDDATGSVLLDNVSVTSTAVPGPPSLVLVAISTVVGVLGRRRFRDRPGRATLAGSN